MASKHEIIVRAVVTSWSVERRGRLYTMQQGLMTPWGSNNPIWIGPYPGKRTKGFPDIFGFELISYYYYDNHQFKEKRIPVYCVVEVKTIAHSKLSPQQKNYLNYCISIGGRAYVAMEDDSSRGYNLTEWVVV